MMIISVLNNQSMLDIAIQYRGAASAAFEIAKTNGKNITDDLTIGETIEIPETFYYNKDITNYYQSKGILPATGVTNTFMEELTDKGIGEMIINVDFMAKAKK